MIILMNPVMCLNFEFCIYIAWLQIPEWWMFVIVGIYIFHIFNIFKICMTIASRRPRWISLKFGGGLHTSRMCVSPNLHPAVPESWGNIGKLLGAKISSLSVLYKMFTIIISNPNFHLPIIFPKKQYLGLMQDKYQHHFQLAYKTPL